MIERLGPTGDAWRHVHVVSTTRRGGVSVAPFDSMNLGAHVGDDPAAVDANRRRLREDCAMPSDPLWLRQVHGRTVTIHDGRSHEPEADAAVAFEPGRICVVMTADCLPVVFTDRAGTRVAVAHAGWRGLAGGVLEATVSTLATAPDKLLAWLGPAIGPNAFEVGGDVRDVFLARDAGHADAFRRNDRGRWWADMYLLARRTLAQAGVGDASGGEECTYTDAARFFSYRRDGRTGRMATLAWLR